jgi:hypothetical protein
MDSCDINFHCATNLLSLFFRASCLVLSFRINLQVYFSTLVDYATSASSTNNNFLPPSTTMPRNEHFTNNMVPSRFTNDRTKKGDHEKRSWKFLPNYYSPVPSELPMKPRLGATPVDFRTPPNVASTPNIIGERFHAFVAAESADGDSTTSDSGEGIPKVRLRKKTRETERRLPRAEKSIEPGRRVRQLPSAVLSTCCKAITHQEELVLPTLPSRRMEKPMQDAEHLCPTNGKVHETHCQQGRRRR